MNEISYGGLMGYLGVDVARPPSQYTYGMSWYSAVWPLTATPLRTQVGLPSTWITPNNDDTKVCLCVPGTGGYKAGWCDGGKCEILFQTIEGGGGMWGDTAFPAAESKWRVNAVPDAYTTYIGSPGYQNGGVRAINASALGLAQLSNRLLMPPDGLTFDPSTNGELLGVAWMSLPLSNPEGYFFLQTKALEGTNVFLEGNKFASASTLGGAAFMTGGVFSGQLFRFVPRSGGYYGLQTLFLEKEGMFLEGNKVAPGSTLGGAAFMAPGGNFSGQLWRLVSQGSGYFRLQTMFTQGEHLCLQAANGIDSSAPLNGAAHMAPWDDSNDRQLWRLIGYPVGGGVPTGPHNWTLFLNSTNYSGPVAYFVADTWSALSRDHSQIVGRGLDLNPAQVVSGVSMEVNTVPYFQAEDGGVTYTRIPRMQFPVGSDSTTRLMVDIKMYSADAIYQPVSIWLNGGGVAPMSFAAGGSTIPPITARPITLKQKAPDGSDLPLANLPDYFVAHSSNNGSFVLKWSSGISALPEYFKQAGGQAQPIPESEVPAATQLTTQQFAAKTSSGPITSPTDPASQWKNPGPVGSPQTATLSDGTTVAYAWYRFIDQPSLGALAWSQDKRDRAQQLVEQMHRAWNVNQPFLPAPTQGSLATLDSNLIVTPPAGCEVGYVPIVVGQTKTNP